MRAEFQVRGGGVEVWRRGGRWWRVGRGLQMQGGSCDNSSHLAKKRRRWSTAQQDAVLGPPNRFGVKKQLAILGRHHASSSSVSSLASFQSKSNPIFEPTEEPSFSTTNNEPEAGERRVQPKRDGARLVSSFDGVCRGRGGGEFQQEQPHPKPRSRLGKISPESSLLSIPTSCDGDWSLENKEENPIESPIMLLHSPSITGKRAFHRLLAESRVVSTDYGEGKWPDVEDEEGPNERDDSALALSLSLRSSDDGAQSVGGPHCPTDEGAQDGEMLSSLEACERRSRELVEKVQANAAEELAQLRSYKSLLEQLRGECTRHEAAAKNWSDLHRDATAQLVSARAEILELERQRRLEVIAIEELKQKQLIEKSLPDATIVSDQLKLESDQGGRRMAGEAQEMELTTASSEPCAIVMREEKRKEAEGHEFNVFTQNDETKVEEGVHMETDNIAETEPGSKRATQETALVVKLCEMETELAAVRSQMEKLQQERDELKIAAEVGERRVAEAYKERDAVVLAVQQEWDSVKVALRQEKEKLEHELTAVWEQNTKLQNELDIKNKSLEAGKRLESRNQEDAGEESLQEVCILGDKVVQPGTERGDSLIALWEDYQKLEVELSDASDHNKKQRSDREALNVALAGVRDCNKKLEGERQVLNATLIGVRDGNRKLEGELSELQLQKTKLEMKRDALLMTVQEERQKLEIERAAVYKAMRGENEKLESEREVLIAMQVYLKKLEMKQNKAQAVEDKPQAIGGDEKRRRKGKRGAPQ